MSVADFVAQGGKIQVLEPGINPEFKKYLRRQARKYWMKKNALSIQESRVQLSIVQTQRG